MVLFYGPIRAYKNYFYKEMVSFRRWMSHFQLLLDLLLMISNIEHIGYLSYGDQILYA